MKHLILTLFIILTTIVTFVLKNLLLNGILYGLSISIILGMTFVSISLSVPNFKLLKEVKAGEFKANDKKTRVKKFVILLEKLNYLSNNKAKLITIIGILIVSLPQLIIYQDIDSDIFFKYTFEIASCISLICFFLSGYCQYEIFKVVLQHNNKVNK